MMAEHEPLKLLSVASESAPLIKTGGLADVVGALPQALAPLGWHTRVLLPAYPGILEKATAAEARLTTVWEDPDLFGGPARAVLASYQGVDYLLLDAPHLYDRPGGPYNADGHDHWDNHVRFAALSWAGARIAQQGTEDGWQPDLVHAHDWQAGLVPSYLKYAGSDIRSVFTIHNIAYQGVFGADQLDNLRLPTWDYHPDGLEYHGAVSTLKAGILHASAVTTVSPTYAKQLESPEFGFGLEGVVAMRAHRGEMTGILNGIDSHVWDPAHDPHTIPYTVARYGRKKENKAALLAEFGLPKPTGPLAVVVTRLTYQKGIDMLIYALPGFLERGGAVIILGSGDAHLEQALLNLRDRYPDRVGVRLGYDEPLSHRMYAGGDLVLVPSRFEPCGLTQMYGLRYGALPLVAATGGLKDTVVDASPENIEARTATGITFSDIDPGGLGFALGRSIDLYADRYVWRRIRAAGMRTDVSWDKSARLYADLFARLAA